MSKSLRVLTQNLFGVPVGPPFYEGFQLYHVHRLCRFRKFVEWVEQKQSLVTSSPRSSESSRTTDSDESKPLPVGSAFVGTGPFDLIALQEVFKWRTGFISRLFLLPLWRCVSASELHPTRCSTLRILFHWMCMVFSWVDGMYWGFLGFVWDDQQYVIDLAKKRLGMNFSSTPKLPPIRYFWHALVWALTGTFAAPIVLARVLLGVWQAVLAAGLVLLTVLLLVVFAICCLRRRIVAHLSSRTQVSPFIIDSGLLLLSREPPSDRGRFVFEYVAGSGLEGFFCQKGAIWLEIKIADNSLLRVMNTHLQSDADGTCRLMPSALRERQFQQLRANCLKTKNQPSRRSSYGSERSNDDPSLLLMGDLNILRRSGDTEYKNAKAIMKLQGLETERLITHRGTQNHFDYIWISAEIVASGRVQAHYGHGSFGFVSDHNGVEGMIVCK